jgi:hypothetical protein
VTWGNFRSLFPLTIAWKPVHCNLLKAGLFSFPVDTKAMPAVTVWQVTCAAKFIFIAFMQQGSGGRLSAYATGQTDFVSELYFILECFPT